MADIGNPTIALMMNRRLVGTARLQIIVPDQLHIGRFGRSADHLLLCPALAVADEQRYRNTSGNTDTTGDHFPPRRFNGDLWLPTLLT
jgi:hypothetical protein